MSRCHLGIGDAAKEAVEEIRVLPFGDLVLNHPEQKRTLSASVLMVIDVAKVRTILEFGDRLNSVVALCPPEELGTGVGSSVCQRSYPKNPRSPRQSIPGLSLSMTPWARICSATP